MKSRRPEGKGLERPWCQGLDPGKGAWPNRLHIRSNLEGLLVVGVCDLFADAPGLLLWGASLIVANRGMGILPMS
jgi:hypothetical protein